MDAYRGELLQPASDIGTANFTKLITFISNSFSYKILFTVNLLLNIYESYIIFL
jgi:hypothetical protein